MHWSADIPRYFFLAKVLRRRSPLLASFKVTHRCNLRCAGCPFHLRAGGPDSHMSWDQARRSLDLLADLGVRIVIFEGGEPLLWEDSGRDFADLARLARERFLRVGLTTNGTFPLDAPVDVIWVSIDGTKATHDRLRDGSFEAMWENLLRSRHPNLLAHVTLSRENYAELPAVMEMLKDAPRVRGATVQFFYPFDDGEEPLMLLLDQRRRAAETAIDLKRQGLPILNSAGRLRAMIDNRWRCHPWMLANVDPDGSVTTGCYAANRGRVSCRDCGFTPVAELSGAYDLLPSSILAGWRTLLRGA